MKKFLWLVTMLIGTSLVAQGNNENKTYKVPYTSEQAAILHSESLAITLNLSQSQKIRVMNYLMKNMTGLGNDNERKMQNRGQRVSSFRNQNGNNVENRHGWEMKNILTEEQYSAWRKTQKPTEIYGEEELKKEHVVEN